MDVKNVHMVLNIVEVMKYHLLMDIGFNKDQIQYFYVKTLTMLVAVVRIQNLDAEKHTMDHFVKVVTMKILSGEETIPQLK